MKISKLQNKKSSPNVVLLWTCTSKLRRQNFLRGCWSLLLCTARTKNKAIKNRNSTSSKWSAKGWKSLPLPILMTQNLWSLLYVSFSVTLQLAVVDLGWMCRMVWSMSHWYWNDRPKPAKKSVECVSFGGCDQVERCLRLLLPLGTTNWQKKQQKLAVNWGHQGCFSNVAIQLTR